MEQQLGKEAKADARQEREATTSDDGQISKANQRIPGKLLQRQAQREVIPRQRGL